MRIGDVIMKKETIRLMAAYRLNGAQKATYPVKNYSYGLGV